MAAPNIVEVSSIVGKSAAVALTTTSATVVVNNPAGSGKVLKVNTLYVSNVDGANVASITISVYPQDDIGGTPVQVCKALQVPAGASVIVISKDAPIYVEEDRSIGATASFANDLDVIASYEEIS